MKHFTAYLGHRKNATSHTIVSRIASPGQALCDTVARIRVSAAYAPDVEKNSDVQKTEALSCWRYVDRMRAGARMSLDIRWLVPVAIYAVAPQCIAAKYMSVEQAQALIFPIAEEYVASPVRLTPRQMQEIDKRSGVTGRTARQSVWRAQSKGELVG